MALSSTSADKSAFGGITGAELGTREEQEP
ncbi:hypothetical protein PIIN_10198 [Serendipita indica DSM 11827]|uniref:Uncharacterized protein n=1 Tax=Serendipita indica (strain DSM 11827) TaxID=1109443 RepID=G4TY12_SERID|nr:hypothetical protein PIIN_10198 [Serendipita indica DSM 11827]